MKLFTPGAPTATLIARSIALVAFLFTCGCTVHEEAPPNTGRRHVDVKVDVDVHRRPRPVCPDGKCPLRQSGCDCGCIGDCDCVQCDTTRRQGDKATRGCIATQPLGASTPSPCPLLSLSPCQPAPRATSPVSLTMGRDSRLYETSPCQAATDCGSESPVMNLPLEARCKNYSGGSCVCASTISLLRWQGRDDLAAALRNSCSGGQSSGSLHAKLERLGVRWAATTSGDVAFLEWAVRTRRGCGITYYPMHFVNLVDLTADHAMLLDNNRVGQYITIPRDEFIRRWRGFGGWATAIVYAPAAPLAQR